MGVVSVKLGLPRRESLLVSHLSLRYANLRQKELLVEGVEEDRQLSQSSEV